MQIEYEATYPDVNKDDVRKRLIAAGAELVRPEFLLRRSTFNLPKGHEITGGWLRVRDEGDKITLSLKVIDGINIQDQKEICLKVDNFEDAEDLLKMIGCVKKSFQESRRELWKLDGVEICIDEWPFLEPYVEIEGKSEEAVRSVSEKLAFNYKKAMFCAVGKLYENKYGIPEYEINNYFPLITFNNNNPFLK